MVFVHNYGIYMIYKIKNNYDNKSKEEYEHLSSDYILNAYIKCKHEFAHKHGMEEKWGCYSMRCSGKFEDNNLRWTCAGSAHSYAKTRHYFTTFIHEIFIRTLRLVSPGDAPRVSG